MNKLLLFFLCLITSVHSSASHVQGGGFQLTHVSANTFTLYFNMYVDVTHALPGLIDGEATALVGIFDKETNEEITRITLQRIAIYHVPEALNCDLKSLNTGLSVYRQNIELDPAIYNNTQGYYISYQRCCRPILIENIIDPDNEGINILYEFPSRAQGAATLNSSSTSPVLKQIPAMVGLSYNLDFSSSDPDGDSLAYKLVIPSAGFANASTVDYVRSGPYPSINWQPGFDLSNSIPGSPSLNINQETGMLNVNPSAEGYFAFTVATEEYRNGIKIASAIRDYVIFVVEQSIVVCVEPPGPFPNFNPPFTAPSSQVPNTSVILAPNPASDYLTINLSEIPGVIEKIEVVDALGDLVSSISITPAITSNNVLAYNIEFLPPGIYVVIIHSSVTTRKERFVKE